MFRQLSSSLPCPDSPRCPGLQRYRALGERAMRHGSCSLPQRREETRRCCSGSYAMPCCCRWWPLASASCAPSGGDHDLLGLLVLIRVPTHEAALHDLVEQRLVADLQEARSLGPVPAHSIEDFLDRHPLGVTSGLTRDVLEADRRVEARPDLDASPRRRASGGGRGSGCRRSPDAPTANCPARRRA